MNNEVKDNQEEEPVNIPTKSTLNPNMEKLETQTESQENPIEKQGKSNEDSSETSQDSKKEEDKTISVLKELDKEPCESQEHIEEKENKLKNANNNDVVEDEKLISNKDKVTKDGSDGKEDCKETAKDSTESEQKIDISRSGEREKSTKEDACEEKSSAKKETDSNGDYNKVSNDNEKSTETDSSQDKATNEKEKEGNSKESKVKENTQRDKIDEKYEDSNEDCQVSKGNEDVKEDSNADSKVAKDNDVSKKDANNEDQEKVPPDNNTDLNSSRQDDEEDVEYEDVEIPENEEEELIVPDTADLCNGDEMEDDDGGDEGQEEGNCNKTDEDDSNTSKPIEEMDEEDGTEFTNQEPELVAIEEANAKETEIANDEEDEDAGANAANDPLNCLADSQEVTEAEEETTKDSNATSSKTNDESSNTGKESETNEATSMDKENEEDDDDDEVLFVETRNSPICIESDEDDDTEVSKTPTPQSVPAIPSATTVTQVETPVTPVETRRETRSSVNARRSNESERQTINLPKATITVPKNLTVTRTSARKSTARPSQAATPSSSPSVPPARESPQNRPKNFQYLQNATNFRRSLPQQQPRQVVDTIELLDSSDEESQGSSSSSSNNRAYLNRSLPNQFGTPPKRTLMAAKNPNKKSPNKMPNFGFIMPKNFPPQIRRQPQKPAPPPLPPATPQSNFLNNFKLQPATVDVANPPAFSALLSNKNVIIPNAFYGNPPGIRTPDSEVERRYARWLDTFIGHFCNPQLVASHSCLSFLQKALKYTDFVRIKATRTDMNAEAQGAAEQPNTQMTLELRSIFLKSSKELTPHGRRFCELCCAIGQNKPITLLVHAVTSKVILKTCNLEIPTSSSSSGGGGSANNANSSSANRKRQLEDDEEEYVPGKKKQHTAAAAAASSAASASHENTDQSSGDGEGPKRSLRSKRNKRLDNSFSYNEDDLAEYDLEDEDEQAERLAREAIQRKIDQKRIEAQRQRQKQAQSFEMAFLKTFARTADGKILTNLPPAKKAVAATPPQRRPVAVNQHHMGQHRDAEEHLRANWIENVENEDTQVISDDDEPREHRIYKQTKQHHPSQLQRQQQQQNQRQRARADTTTSSSSASSSPKENPRCNTTNPRNWPKNTNISHTVISKNKDVCFVCKLSVQRIVHHYVNEHRGCEVYNSRLAAYQVDQLKRGMCNIKNVSIYKNGQPQYEAYCVFCQKYSRFMFPYWVQHFTMHTGEYAYRCSACGMRKPTRSLLTQHQSQGCAEGGGSVLVDYNYDPRKIRVEARICTLCNYIQLHRNNIVKHLHQQHNIKQILPKHIQTIVLLKEAADGGGSAADSSMSTGGEIRNHSSRRSSVVTSQNSNVSYTIIEDDDDDDDNTLLFSEDALPPIMTQQQQQQLVEATQQQNHYYNYIPPYMMNQINQQQQQQQNFTWEDNDPTDDLSFMICGMLDVQMNNNKKD
ncbi:uncharacterized protein [Musca autumnalis]|uniref:uncharacterized protein n=1 Tax=Musca autumnalis TaxID=221902 RepID=UPI003CF6EAC6